jgi:hypothetical protein
VATDDCFEIGRGPCPCGNGIVTVEKCIPDHPWAKESQASYTPALVCSACERKYAFSGPHILSGRRSLVLRKDLEGYQDARSHWHATLRKIEATEDFKKIANALNDRLDIEKSGAARHRILVSAGLTHDSIGQFRRHGFHLSSLNIREAMKLLAYQSAELERLADEADVYAERMQRDMPPVKTGIAGLEH